MTKSQLSTKIKLDLVLRHRVKAKGFKKVNFTISLCPRTSRTCQELVMTTRATTPYRLQPQR